MTPQELFAQFDPPYETFDNSMLGTEFPAELDLVSRLWFRCGYRPGIGAYLNFFLLREPQGFVALSRWCRHMNGLLTYQREHWRFLCAFHGATFNLEGLTTGLQSNGSTVRR